MNAVKKRAKLRHDAQAVLEGITKSETATDAQKVGAARALLLDTRDRTRKKKPTDSKLSDSITGEDIRLMRERMSGEPGLEGFAQRRGDGKFVEEFRARAERHLYFFTKFTGIAPDLTAKFHQEVCNWLQKWPAPGSEVERIKLFMMPTQHLKTAVASHGLPLHMVIQPKEHNIYFPGRLGRELRIALIGESADKAEENLSVVEGHLDANKWIRALWPSCVWADVSKAPKWSQKFATVPRDNIKGEPTFTALGVGTKLYQRHYDFIDCDDIIGWDAAGSPDLMKDINEWRKGLLTRRHSPMESIMLYIGTHFTPTDVYVHLKSELPKSNVISRSIVEQGEPIWPERFPMNVVEQLKRTMGPRLFSHLMMNLPTAEGFTGFDWNQVRLFEFEEERPGERGTIRFMEDATDDEIRAIYADPITQVLSRWKKGAPLSSLYPNHSGQEYIDPYDEKERGRFDKMSAGQQVEVRQRYFLSGLYGRNGEETEFVKNAEHATDGGKGFDSVQVSAPTSRVVRRDPNSV